MIGVTALVMLIVCGLRVLSPHYPDVLEAFAVAAPQTRLQALALRPGPMRRHPLLAAAEPGPDRIPHLDAIAALARPSPMVTVPAGWFLMGTNLKHDAPFSLETQFDDTEQPQRRSWLDPVELDRDEGRLAWRCSASITCTRSRWSRRWTAARRGRVLMERGTWPATSPSGSRTGSGSIITSRCRSAILKVRRPAATRACAAAPGRAIRTCCARRRATARSRTNAPPRSASAARSEERGSCRRVTRTCSRSAKGKQVALCSARVPLGVTRACFSVHINNSARPYSGHVRPS